MTHALPQELRPEAVDVAREGERLHAFAREIFPWPRATTGEGLRRTLDAVGKIVPLERVRVPTGERILDWTAPREWVLRQAWVRGPDGSLVADAARSPLEVASYSRPFRGRVSRAELDAHLYSEPEHPDWIPYRTLTYREDWGFCVPHRVRESLPDGEYEVCVDTELVDGALEWGECVVPGRETREVLVSTHVCHPALANDNASGIAVTTELARRVAAAAPLRYTYRFLFLPTIIGSIAWLARNRDRVGQVAHGMVVACVGDPGAFTLKHSRRGDTEIDRAASLALDELGEPHAEEDFSPYGYDERNWCSPGFDLAVVALSRTPHGRYPQYHTSADDLDFVTPEGLGGSLRAHLAVLSILERNRTYRSTWPWGEPQLGRRGLYDAIGGLRDRHGAEMAMFWVLNQADGSRDLVEVARRSGIAFHVVADVADRLREAGLLEPVEET